MSHNTDAQSWFMAEQKQEYESCSWCKGLTELVCTFLHSYKCIKNKLDI